MTTDTRPEETTSRARLDTITEDPHAGIVRREDQVAHNSFVARLAATVEAGEASIHRWLVRYSMTALRISIGVVYFAFGILKYFPGVSPAEDLALATTHLLTFGLVPAVVPNTVAMALIATLECAIGLLLITGRWLRLTLSLLVGHLIGIWSPVVILAGRIFAGPHHMPTLEGQYIFKDLILVAAAMVIATSVRGGTITDGGHRSLRAE